MKNNGVRVMLFLLLFFSSSVATPLFAQDDVVDLAGGQAGVLERLLERDPAALDEVGGHLLELRPAERLVEVQRTVGRRRDERQVDLGLLGLAEFDLRFLRGLLQTLRGHAIGAEVDAVRRLELLDEPVDDALVPVVATEVGVTVGEGVPPGLNASHTANDTTAAAQTEARLIHVL